MEEIESIENKLKKEVMDFIDLHEWSSSMQIASSYTGFHMVNVAIDNIKDFKKQNKQLLETIEKSQQIVNVVAAENDTLRKTVESLKCCGNCKHSFGDDCFKNQNYIDNYHSVCDGWEFGDICKVGE